MHPFRDDEATKHTLMRGFYEAAKTEGQVVSVEFTPEKFFITELDAVAPGAACSVVWDIDNCLCVANESAKHTGLTVEPCFLQTTPMHNDRSAPTPTSLAKMVEAQNLMSNINRRAGKTHQTRCGPRLQRARALIWTRTRAADRAAAA